VEDGGKKKSGKTEKTKTKASWPNAMRGRGKREQGNGREGSSPSSSLEGSHHSRKKMSGNPKGRRDALKRKSPLSGHSERCKVLYREYAGRKN